jgi:hypothetical protein
MANPENIIGKGHRFSSTNQPANRGRKPSKIKRLIKKYDLPKSDIDAVIQNILFDHTLGELEELAKDRAKQNKLPAFAGYLLALLQKSAEKGDPHVIQYFLDRVYGRPMQAMDVTADANIQLLPDEAKKKMADIYESMRAGNKATVKPQNVKKQRRVVEDDSL